MEVSNQIDTCAALFAGKVSVPTEQEEEEKENHTKTGETPTTDLVQIRRIV